MDLFFITRPADYIPFFPNCKHLSKRYQYLYQLCRAHVRIFIVKSVIMHPGKK